MFIVFLAIALIGILLALNALYQAGRTRGAEEGFKVGRTIERDLPGASEEQQREAIGWAIAELKADSNL